MNGCMEQKRQEQVPKDTKAPVTGRRFGKEVAQDL